MLSDRALWNGFICTVTHCVSLKHTYFLWDTCFMLIISFVNYAFYSGINRSFTFLQSLEQQILSIEPLKFVSSCVSNLQNGLLAEKQSKNGDNFSSLQNSGLQIFVNTISNDSATSSKVPAENYIRFVLDLIVAMLFLVILTVQK